jgi:hypothetical protein
LPLVIRFNFNTAPIEKYAQLARADLRAIPEGPLRDGIRQAALTALFYERLRFARNAAGGGDWAPLAKSTLAKKTPRKGILRVSDRLSKSLEPTSKDNVLKDIPRGVRYGTAVDYAKYHMGPTANRPARKPMQLPDPTVLRHMRRNVAKGIGLQGRQWANAAARLSVVRLQAAVRAAAPLVV